MDVVGLLKGWRDFRLNRCMVIYGVDVGHFDMLYSPLEVSFLLLFILGWRVDGQYRG